jgi:formylglycine-generating enzyme required for sulfatase activity
MTIRRVRSRIRPTAAAAHLSAVAHRILPLTVLCAFPWVLLGAQLAAPAAAQSKDQEVYPKAPPGPPPVTKVEGADAKDEADMKAYEEGITGTDATFKLIPIPGGEFLMGSPADEEGRSDFEGPQVKVRVSPFWMGTHEVAWKEYSQYMDSLDMRARNLAEGSSRSEQDPWSDAVSRPTPPYVPMDFDMGVDGYPAISMTQFAAKQYTKWLTMKTGRFYRLPTEAEWEYACRAGTTGAFSFPEGELDDHGWWFDNCDGQYMKLGTRKPNPWGLYDMHGNVAEWCLDAFSKDGYADLALQAKEGPVVDPIRWPKALYPRVARGGHWDEDPERLRSASRRGSNDDWKVQDPQLPKSIWYHTDAPWLGFRVVRPLNPPPPEEWARYHDSDLDSITKIYDRQRRAER